jgi:3-oxoacyl-[acyl-carrier protein] reductase
MLLSGKKAIITGGSEGLGFAIAEAFVREGASVAICARDKTKLKEARQKLSSIKKPGQLVWSKPCDLSKPKQIQSFISATEKKLGEIDILVNNAGVIGPMGPLETADWNAWRQTLEINLFGAALACRALLPGFKQRKRGKIVNISGGGATAPFPYFTAYALSKVALVRLTETLAMELKEFNVQVNAVAPGMLNTSMMQDIVDAGPAYMGEGEFAKYQKVRSGEAGVSPTEPAELCAWLASDKSDAVTGKLISAAWDPWRKFDPHLSDLQKTDIYTLRRILPEDRGQKWG